MMRVVRLGRDVDEVRRNRFRHINVLRRKRLRIVNALRVMLMILMKWVNLRRCGCRRYVIRIVIVDRPRVNRRPRLLVEHVGLCWQMSARSAVAEAVRNVIDRVSDAVGAHVAVITTHDFVRPVTRRLLLDLNAVVGAVLVAKAAVGRPAVIV